MKRPPVWTLEEALTLCRELAGHLTAHAVALTGSVLTKGASRKDLDLVLYPLTTAENDLDSLRQQLMAFGMTPLFTREIVLKQWHRLGSSDDKWVEVWSFQDKRIDLFLLK
jgi:hypothetical protein